MDIQDETQGRTEVTDKIVIRNIEPKVIAQGWQCPKCQRIHSPSVNMCNYCAVGGASVTYGNNTTLEVS